MTRGWTLTPVNPAERPLLERLGQLYLYDFSAFTGWDIGEDGLFDHDGWSRGLWAHPGRTSLLLRIAEKPAGFAIVDERSPFAGDEPCRYMAEFFIMRKYRRRRLGEAVAGEVFDRFPGPWYVLEMKENLAARAFWPAVITRYLGYAPDEFITSHGDLVQTFTVSKNEGGVS
ncbi:MAG TPA: GNAT family N-acetyltransferase [Thermomicrobiales bacterium]|nr:GNAT family N-acetyltransferase [Thermomicrobiales bacterium]